jgi:hypothetical protein
MSRVFRLLPDSFTAAIIAVVALAVMLPCSGDSARLVGIGSEVAIAVLFFLQGARLSRSAVLGAALHWRLHGIILAATFLVFPLLGLALSLLSGTVRVCRSMSACSFSAHCPRQCKHPWCSPQSQAATWRQRCAAHRFQA